MTGPLAGLASLNRVVDGLKMADPDPSTVKACCAAAYGIDLVELFLGASYHPGGADLTRRLADCLSLGRGEQVLDVACGIGTTGLLLAAERGVDVLGIDLGDAQVERARGRARAAGLGGRVRFKVGDAERLPVDDRAYDAVVCECALCTFPDKVSAASELARAVRSRGRVGIADVWLDPGRLDPDLATLAGRVSCLADARPIDETCDLFESVGFTIDRVERHDQALLETIEQIEARLRGLRLVNPPALRPFNLRRGIELARRAAGAVSRGDAGYVLIVATSEANGFVAKE
jgi:SAM-dependent methyltransferase